MAFLDLLRPPTITTVDVRTEVLAGITTFLTMAYILFVNPAIVGTGFELALEHAIGSDVLAPQYQELIYTVKLGIAAGTAIAAAFGTLFMAFFARLPFAMAPGMGGERVHSLFRNTCLHSHVTEYRSSRATRCRDRTNGGVNCGLY